MTNLLLVPPAPDKPEGLFHTRASSPAAVPAEAGSSGLSSWAGGCSKEKTLFCYLLCDFLWHGKGAIFALGNVGCYQLIPPSLSLSGKQLMPKLNVQVSKHTHFWEEERVIL